MKHEEVVHEGIRTTFSDNGMSAMSVSVTKTWCAHCLTWVETDGVIGALKFMANHRDGDCAK